MPQIRENRNIFFIRTQSHFQKDERLLASHPVYHIGRFLALIGSAVIAFGLLCKFIFVEEAKSEIPIITITVSVVGCVIFMIAVCLLAVAAYKSQMAVMRHQKERRNQASTISDGQMNPNDSIVAEIITSQQNWNPSEPVSNGITAGITVSTAIN